MDVMALPLSYKEDEESKKNRTITWKEFLLNRVKPIYSRLVRISNIETLREHIKNRNSYFKQHNKKKYNEYVAMLKNNLFPPRSEIAYSALRGQDWPVDVGIFIAIHCYLCCAPIKGHSYFGFGFLITEDSTESFAFWDSYNLERETHWWAYVVLKGSVRVPLAPENYGKDKERGELVEIGRGGILVFSPRWNGSEFGMEWEFTEPCDEWVIANLEEPVSDSPPCGWPSIFEFLTELERIAK